jgi:hypothetical protein
MDIKNIKDMQKFEQGNNKPDYDATKSGELHPFVEKEYLKSKKDSEKTGSPFVTTSYKNFLDRYKKTYSKNAKILNESVDFRRGKIEIDITRDEDRNYYNVSYVYEDENKYESDFYQFSGYIQSVNTGRGLAYEFNSDWFMDEESEIFYENNHEIIEQQILDKFYEIKRFIG